MAPGPAPEMTEGGDLEMLGEECTLALPSWEGLPEGCSITRDSCVVKVISRDKRIKYGPMS
jgi:hypothetical protein